MSTTTGTRKLASNRCNLEFSMDGKQQFLSEASFLTGVSLDFAQWAIGSGLKKIVERNS